MPRLLEDREVDEMLKDIPGWRRRDRFIEKSYEFPEFLDGIAFVDRVARVAEGQEHHPDIHVRYTTVTLSIQTHSEGGITEWDLDLARAIEKDTS